MADTPKGRATRARILDAAWDLSDARGAEVILGGVTLREIAARGGHDPVRDHLSLPDDALARGRDGRAPRGRRLVDPARGRGPAAGPGVRGRSRRHGPARGPDQLGPADRAERGGLRTSPDPLLRGDRRQPRSGRDPTPDRVDDLVVDRLHRDDLPPHRRGAGAATGRAVHLRRPGAWCSSGVRGSPLPLDVQPVRGAPRPGRRPAGRHGQRPGGAGAPVGGPGGGERGAPPVHRPRPIATRPPTCAWPSSPRRSSPTASTGSASPRRGACSRSIRRRPPRGSARCRSWRRCRSAATCRRSATRSSVAATSARRSASPTGSTSSGAASCPIVTPRWPCCTSASAPQPGGPRAGTTSALQCRSDRPWPSRSSSCSTRPTARPSTWPTWWSTTCWAMARHVHGRRS